MTVGWDRLRLAVASREPRIVDAPGLRRAAVSMVLRDGAAGIEMLFIRRAEDPQDPWSGHIGFPGGRVEPSDAGFHQAAVRETREEVGIDLDRWGDFFGPLDQIRAIARMRPVDLCIAPFVWRLTGEQEVEPNDEVASAHWVLLDALLDPPAQGTMEYEHGGAMLRFPCLRVDDLVIWGLTYRMFSELAERLAGVEAAANVRQVSAP